MKVLTTATFARQVKKLHPNEKSELDLAVRSLMSDPQAGEQKKGDLAGIWVYKYKHNSQLWLLAYTFESESSITLRLVGAHENFYRDLKRNAGN